ncbi:Agglutinin-like protein 3 [Candida viswanathii]|uniref:Agglutinin-like protein 3 n=1 Tax=Candida viswanathii TaxID=5486 RepID=A0A367YMF1_9ASCO|nr:Agglutinin-like protein 3 [Candida viswanathii]
MTFFGPLLLLALVTQVVSREIVGIFTDLLSLDFQDAGYGYRGPANPIWYAKLSWNLDGAIHNPGDTFTLNLPGVFKFVTGQSQLTISAGGICYATCTFQAGEQFMTFSVINCVVSDSLTANIQAYGTVSFPFSFSAGGSALEVDLVNANQFKVGTNTITFRHGNIDLSVEADFQRDPFPKAELISHGKIIPSLRKVCHILVCAECTDGYESGVLGLATSDPAVAIDCESVHIGATSELNPWLHPINSESLEHTKECDAGKLLITFKNVPAGYRPFVDTLFDSTSDKPVSLQYTNKFTCMNGKYYDKSTYKTWAPYKNGLPDSDGVIIVVTTRTDTYSTTAVTTLPFDPEKDTTKIIEVIVPIPTTTTTTSYVGIKTYYSTITGTIGGTATVIVNEPVHTTTTVTTCWLRDGTTTFTDIPLYNSIDTVVIQTEHTNPTVTTRGYDNIMEPTSYTAFNPCGGTDTVFIAYPSNGFTTRTTFSPVEQLTTYTETDTHGGTDTVVVVYPHNEVITTTTVDGVEELTTCTQTDTHGGTDTVVVVYPPNPTVTTTDFDSVSELTSYTQTDSHGGTDTIVIVYPFSSSDVTDMRESTTSLTLDPDNTDSAEDSDSTGAVSYPTTLLPAFISADDEIPIPSGSSDIDGDYGSASSHPGDDISTTDSNESVTIAISIADDEAPPNSDDEVPTDSYDDATVTSSVDNSDIALSDDDFTASVTGQVDETTSTNASDDVIASDSDDGEVQTASILEDEMPTDSFDGDEASTNNDDDVSMAYESSTTDDSFTISTNTIDVTIDDSETTDDPVSQSNDDTPSTSDPAAPIPDPTLLPEDDSELTSDTADVSIVVVSTVSSDGYVSTSTIDNDGNVSSDSTSSTSRHPTSIAAAPPVYTTDESITSSNDDQVTSATLTDDGDDSPSISETGGFTTTDIAVTSEIDESGNNDDYYITSLSLDVILSCSIRGGRPKYANISYGRSSAAPGPVYTSDTHVTTSTVGEGGNDVTTTEEHNNASQAATAPAIIIPPSKIVTVTECTSDCTLFPSGGQQGTSDDTSGECSTGCHSGDGKVTETEGAACSTGCTARSQKATATDADQSSTSCTLAVCGKNHGKGSNRENSDGEGNEGGDGNEGDEGDGGDGGDGVVSGEGKCHNQVNEDEGSGSGAPSTGDGSTPELDNDADREEDEPTVTFPISESTLSTAVIDHEYGNSLAANNIGGSTFTFDATSISNYEGSAALARASTWLVCLISVLNILI